jgi:hypothetical protein
MFVQPLRTVIVRDLRALAREVAAYPDDESLWRVMPGITNPGGTLAVHLAGNLRHFIGTRLGAGSYVRDRKAEFAGTPRPRAEVIAEIERTIAEVDAALARLDDASLERPFPDPLYGRTLDIDVLALHLAVHLGYHLGQIDYHRRIVTGNGATVDAMSLMELPETRGERTVAS